MTRNLLSNIEVQCFLVGLRRRDTPPDHDVARANRWHAGRLPSEEQHHDHHQCQKTVQLWWFRYGGFLLRFGGVCE